jgi:hypothetical protein
MCIRSDRLDDLRCNRRITADKLESFVVDAAIDVLERLQVTGREAATLLSEADTAAIEADRAELDELKDMWKARELTTREYREMRKVVEDRISVLEAKAIVRPIPEILKEVSGPNARKNWEALQKAEEFDRMNAILRFLFAAVIIDKSTKPQGSFDYGRINIEENPI